MDMEDAAGLWMLQMDLGVDVERDLAQFAPTLHDVSVEIAQDQLAGGQLAEMQAARIDQEELPAAGQHHAVVVGNLLIHAEPREYPEHGGKVAARLPFILCGERRAWQHLAMPPYR